MSFPQYPSYKDSGVEWLGDLPVSWEVKPIRRVIAAPLANGIFKKKEEFGDGVLLVNVFDIYRPDFKVAFDTLDRVRCDAGETAAYEVRAGDLFFVRSSLKQEGIAVVAMADRSPVPVVYECHLIRARPATHMFDGRFGSYLLNSAVYRATMEAKAKVTTMTTIDQEAILSTRLPIPSVLEQVAISAFLDRETRKIDELVTEQRRLIELLKEKRHAVISHAVTRGLNPDALLKPSGIEWLGKVPAHWETSSFRHSVTSIFNGLTAEQIDESESTVPVTRIETISTGIIDETRMGFIDKENARADRRLKKGDILFSNINSLNIIGNCAFYSGGREIYAGMNLLVLRPGALRYPRWLYWLVRSRVFREVVESLAKPAINQASISQTSLYGIVIPVPSNEEQLEIARYLDVETVKLGTLTAEAQRAIDLLQERRIALISAAVTGQIDVRHLVDKEAA